MGRRIANATSPAADVLVLGGGLAGLAAARRLAAAGARPLVLEARDRPGGRAHTRFDLPDRAEYGGVEIGDSYTRLHTLAEACGQRVAPSEDRRAAGLTLHVNGRTLDASHWSESPANRLSGTERQVLPAHLERHYLATDIPLARAADWDAPASGVHDRAIGLELRARGASDEAMRLVNVAGNHNHSDAVSVLGWWRSALLFRQETGVGRLVEGAGALARCLAAELGGAVRYRSVVATISTDNGFVKVRLTDGSELRARNCICTLPLPALRNVRLDLPLDASQRRVIADAAYHPGHGGPVRCRSLLGGGRAANHDVDRFAAGAPLSANACRNRRVHRLQGVHQRRRHRGGRWPGRSGLCGTRLDHLRAHPAEFGWPGALPDPARLGSGPRSPAAPTPLGHRARSPNGRAAVRRPTGPVRFAGEHTANAPGMEGAIRSGEDAAQAIVFPA